MGVPWALLLAAGLVAALEVYLHTRDPMSLIAYASDEGQYRAVRDTVEAQGAAEVALVGSSQMQEGVLMPQLLADLKKRLGRPVWVANYAVRGARADAMNAEVRFLQRQPKPPALIVVGISPRDVRALQPDWPRLAILWSPADWWRAFRRRPRDALPVLPQVIRNVAGRALYALRYREEISLTLQRSFGRFGVDTREDGNPILGQDTDAHLGARGLRSINDAHMPLHRIFDRAVDNYLLHSPAKPPAPLRAALHDLVSDFAGHPQAGLLVQMPVIRALEDVLDADGQSREFAKAMAAETAKVPVRFVPAATQPVWLGPEDFSDLQHLNRPGAEQFTRWLAGVIAIQLDARSR